MSSLLAEMIGTMLLVLLGDGVVAGVLLVRSKGAHAGWLMIAVGWGLAVTMALYFVGKFSGGHINPAVTLALASIGSFPWAKVPYYILAQLIGAFCGGVLVWLHYLPHWKLTRDKSVKLAVFATSPAVRKTWSNLLSEVIGTFVLVFGILAIGENKFTEGLNPLVIGCLIVAIGLSLGETTGYAINPARDFGPRLAHFLLPIEGKGDSDFPYSWIPIVGPVIGGITAALTFKSIFAGCTSPVLWLMEIIIIAIVLAAIISESNK
jgi:glycerol uptake facilitator protein